MILSGRHVLLIGLGFFAVVASVNAGMIYVALSTFSGIETENAYLHGLAYNEVLNDAERQAAMDWQVEVATRQLGDRTLAVEATFRDRYGEPVRGLKIALDLTRPTHRGHDRRVALEELGRGRYGAEIELPLVGQWDLGLQARRDGTPLYTREQRLWLK